EAGGRECAHDPEAAPEHEALPKSRALSLCAGELRRDPFPNLRRRSDFREFCCPGRKPLFPRRDQGGKSTIASDALRGGGAFRASQHAERILGCKQFVRGKLLVVVDVGHCSRQTFNLIIARRIQLFMVPKGTFMRSASSSSVLPSKNAPRKPGRSCPARPSRQRCSFARSCSLAEPRRRSACRRRAQQPPRAGPCAGSARARKWSMARLRAIAISQVIGLDKAASKTA